MCYSSLFLGVSVALIFFTLRKLDFSADSEVIFLLWEKGISELYNTETALFRDFQVMYSADSVLI